MQSKEPSPLYLYRPPCAVHSLVSREGVIRAKEPVTMAMRVPQSLEFGDKKGESWVLRAFQKGLDLMLRPGRLHMVSEQKSQAGSQASLGSLAFASGSA